MHRPQDPSLARDVTDAERDTFERDGVVLLRSIQREEWVEYLEAQLDDVFDGNVDRSMDQRSVSGQSNSGIRVDMAALAGGLRARQPDVVLAVDGDPSAEFTGRSLVETDAAVWHEGMWHHNVHGPLRQLVAELTGSAQVNFYADQLFLKEPGSRMRTPFHQDKPYFLVDGGDVTVCWVPVDVVTIENGAMGYVRGSHKWGKVFKPSDFVTDTGTFPQRDGIDHSGLELLDPIEPNDPDLVYFDAEPGDVIVHHWATVHGSAGNVSATARRRAASIRFAGEGCTYFRRKSSPEPFRFTGELTDGDRLELSPRYPIVWPRQRSLSTGFP